MGLMLDSSVLIAAERNSLDLERLSASLGSEPCYISAVTLSELWHGCHRGAGKSLQNRLNFVRNIEAVLPVLQFSREEALIHARVWAALEKVGKRIGSHDLIIAATALAHDHSLATLNEAEFKRVPKLRLFPLARFIRR